MPAPFWFQKIAKRAAALKAVSGATVAETRAWFREQAGRVYQVSTDRLLNETASRTFKTLDQFDIGSMLCFYYDPKLKATLPFYDRFPLIFPFAEESDRFYGINMHYLPPVLRAKLMDALYTVAETNSKNKIVKLKLSYAILKGMGKLYKPCVKCYLKSHVRSRFMYIAPKEWDMALFLPLERFEKATKEEVWADSRRKING
jgi:hypothetical protein